MELNVFRIGLGKRFPKGGEHSREECTRSPLGAVSSVTRVVLAWRPQNKRCLLGSAGPCRLLTCITCDARSRKGDVLSVAVSEGSEKESSVTRTTP